MKNPDILQRTARALEASPYDAVLIFGAENVRYLSGASVPFLGTTPPASVRIFWQKGSDEPVLFCPDEWLDVFRKSGGITNVQPSGGSAFSPVSPDGEIPIFPDFLELRSTKKIGITFETVPVSFFRSLEKKLPGVAFDSCDGWVRDLRMVKTPAEIELLETAALKIDHAIAGAAHHVMVYAARPEKGLSELLRVHALERGMDSTCYESLAVGASGPHAAVPWPEAPCYGVGGGKQLEEGELVRLELRNSLDAYWSDGARVLTMGPPSAEQTRGYEGFNLIREQALNILRPGIRCSDAAARILDFCKKSHIPILEEYGLGHGIGVAAVEAPFLEKNDDTPLAAGMVIVLSPVLKGPDGELLRSNDTLIIESEGARLTGWYKNWNSPYRAASSYQHGGG